jgi:hypothetical protein
MLQCKLFAGCVLSLMLVEQVSAGVITFGLETPEVTSGTAAFNVTVDFQGDLGDQIESFQLSVIGSDTLLTDGDTNFSRFSFLPDAVNLPTWFEFVPLASGLGFYAPLDPFAGPFLSPTSGPVSIGTLTVDLSGIAGGLNLFVTLAGGSPGFETDAGGTLGGDFVPSLAFDLNHAVAFGQPTDVFFETPDLQAVPEPSTLALFSLGAVGLGIGANRRRRRRLTWSSNEAGFP